MSVDKNTKEAYGTHTFTTAGSYDDSSCEDCGVNILAFYKDPRICNMQLKWKIKPSAFTDEHKTSSKLAQALPQDNEALSIAESMAAQIMATWETETPTKQQMKMDIKLSIAMCINTEQTRLKAELIAKLRESLPKKVEYLRDADGNYLDDKEPRAKIRVVANEVLDQVTAALDTLER